MAEKAGVHAKAQESKQKCSNSCNQKSIYTSFRSPADRILQLQRTAGNQAVQRLIKSRALQAKLRVGQPKDSYEQEADRVAEQVMRMPEVTRHTGGTGIKRKCPKCRNGKKDEKLQAKKTSGKISEVTPHIEANISSMRGGGQPLPESVRAFFEPRFGRDFRQVRMHTGAKAVESARAVNAQAYTVGKDVVFGAGQYIPGTIKGNKLLAHELTHVVQQTSSSIDLDRTLDDPEIIHPERRFSESKGAKTLNVSETKSSVLQYQLEEPPGPPELPDITGCSIDLFELKKLLDGKGDKETAKKIIDCCNLIPSLEFCTSDIIEAAQKLLEEPEIKCPKPFETSSGETKGLCCEKFKRDKDHCCNTDRANILSGKCCPEGAFFDGQKCKLPPPIPLCLLGQMTIDGKCCKLPLVPQGFQCIMPTKPCPPQQMTIDGKCCKLPLVPQGLQCILPTKPLPPLPHSEQIFFNFDMPKRGASGVSAFNSSITSEGKSNFKKLIEQLKANPQLQVQFIGMASPEGNVEYNMELGERRANLIAEAVIREGISESRIADPPSDLRSECRKVNPGIVTCGKAGSTGSRDRQVLTRLFMPNQIP